MNRILKRNLILGALLATAVSCTKGEPSFPVDSTPVEGSRPGIVSSYADVLEPARAAVVSVTTENIVKSYRNRGGQGSPFEDLLRRFYGIPSPEVPQDRQEPEERRVPNGLGSGVIISADGYILTNNHVVSTENGDPADAIEVRLADDREYKAELIGRDPQSDIAVIKIEGADLPHVVIADSENLRVGDIVFAVGNPLGIGPTTTMGVVSAVGRAIGILGNDGYENFIQTDAAINRGNSGGALLDAAGRLVGINSAIVSPVGANIGLGFAIPTSLAVEIATELVAHGEIQRGFLGIQISDLDQDMAESFGLKSTKGVLIEDVHEGLPADEAGLERGDVIVEVNGKPVKGVSDLRIRIAAIAPGSSAEIVAIRDGERKTFDVTVTSADNANVVGADGSGTLFEGVEVAPVTPEVRDEWDLEGVDGLIVTEVDPRSEYSRAIRVGMVILEINGRRVNSLSEARERLRSDRANRLWIWYRGRSGYIAVRVP